MRHASILAILVLTAFTLGACGGDDSGNGNDPVGFSDDGLDPAPSSKVPALVDTKGMTVAQLEKKVEEIEALHDVLMEEMGEMAKANRGGAPSPEEARKLMQVTADMRALREQMLAYENAIDALER